MKNTIDVDNNFLVVIISWKVVVFLGTKPSQKVCFIILLFYYFISRSEGVKERSCAYTKWSLLVSTLWSLITDAMLYVAKLVAKLFG